jgi:hypothetical protein
MPAELRVDPNARIPAAAKAAGKRADDLHSKIYSKEPPAEEPKDGAKDPVEPATTEPAAAAPAEPTAATPPTPVTPQGNPTPAPSDEDTWKHKYDSMKGRFDRSQGQIRQLSEQIGQLQLQLQARAQPAPVAPAAQSPLLSPKEVEEYGSEFLDVVGKKAKETFSPEIQELKAQVASLTEQLGNVNGVVATDVQARFFSDLDRSLPNWGELNTNEDFIAWLKLPDAYSGVIRHELLNAAYERKDAPRVLAFFKGFLAEEAATDPARLAPTPAPAATPAPGKVPLETFAAPGRAKSTAATAPAEKPIIHRAQITQFYLDVSAGKYRGKEGEKDRLEAMIFAAEKEGRIR